ncbi:SDR family oxidoreductase [Clostridium algidicarnis]|uniref:SDR family oxidoreductase n=1 Tax=Clostridium algidicarnis TaxID=37659 RepID=UPI001C0DC288|nr:NAD(P)-dependent oxidoreductase [Clostridium algidicarnis]MBU3202664.1 NAD(P)-dependent oxidoreductase [Clostridium algidicarnis]MBU3210818.1 NAD(P)-dependent oxidoreductase [Clostridium algidicarnis]MBU3222674.1 NAD(P)-dependent oxidoreductase [Clostridium algidicarnis]
MKILISGSNGNIGSYLTTSLSDEHQIYSFSKSDFDVTNKSQICDVICKTTPDIILHTAAITDVDYCESNESLAYSTNTLGTLNIASMCYKFNIPIVYISTSYVYGDYKSSPYVETDICDPINIYGKTKLEGENLIRTLLNNFFIIRTSWVIDANKCSILKMLDNPSPIVLCSLEKTNVTSIKDLSYFINTIIKTDNYGIYNLSSEDYSSKYDIVTQLLKNKRFDKNILKLPEKLLVNTAKRPSFSAINSTKAKDTFSIPLRRLDDIILEL